MNYFAHARLAATRTRGPRFVLGAMLPDWIRWIGARLDHVGDPLLAAGIAFHHRCDAAFHKSPRFAERVRAAGVALRAGGLARGPARAAAHVGVELLLDGVLHGASEAADRRAYREALAAAPAATRHVVWSRSGATARFERVSRRLLTDDPVRGFRDPERVASGVARTLAQRPRLRVDPVHFPALRDWARAEQPEIERHAPAILAETEAGLRETA